MKSPPREPVRFLDQPAHNDTGEVARLIRHAISLPETPAPVLKGRIRHTLRRRSASKRRHLRVLLVGGAVFISGGVVGAVVQPMLRLRSQAKVESIESIGPASPGRRGRAVRPARAPNVVGSGEPVPASADEIAPPTPAEPMVETPGPLAPSAPLVAPSVERPVAMVEPASARVQRVKALAEKRPALPVSAAKLQPHPVPMALRPPKPAAASNAPLLQPPAFATPALPLPLESPDTTLRHISPAKAAAPPAQPPTAAPAPSGPPPSEQTLVARAIGSLRVQRRPATALAALDEYEARYPKGGMLAEVARLRAEALLLLGQNRAALDELSRTPSAGTARDEESRLVRGELRASAGRWQEALADFDALVSAWLGAGAHAALSPKLQGRVERALWGRACARSHLGDEAGARADLQEILVRFPQGRFAAQASNRLAGPR